MNQSKLIIGFALITFSACSQPANKKNNMNSKMEMDSNTNENHKYEIVKSDDEWKKTLTPEQFEILRLKGTESPGTGKLLHNKDEGTYICAACKNELFNSESKFDAHCGWPSFYAEKAKGKILYKTDKTIGMSRTEILCAKCGGHLGHVFDDGPKPTGLRYCVNSISIEFVPAPKK